MHQYIVKHVFSDSPDVTSHFHVVFKEFQCSCLILFNITKVPSWMCMSWLRGSFDSTDHLYIMKSLQPCLTELESVMVPM